MEFRKLTIEERLYHEKRKKSILEWADKEIKKAKSQTHRTLICKKRNELLNELGDEIMDKVVTK